MICTFKDFYAPFVNSAKVLILFGEHEIFKNSLSDSYFEANQSFVDFLPDIQDLDILSEFTMKEKQQENIYGKKENSTQNRLFTVSDFLSKAGQTSLLGKWQARFSIDELSEKEIKELIAYSKKPSDTAVLVLTSREFKKQLPWLKEKAFEASKDTHLFKLQFPTKSFMKRFIWKQADIRKIKIADKALDLLFSRLGNNYDGYQEILDRLATTYYKHNISYEVMVQELKGVDYYSMDNFLIKLLVVENSNGKKISKNKLIYKMANSLIENEEATTVLKKILYKIEDCIKMRLLLNQGIVPTGIAFSVADVKERIGENGDPKLLKLSEFQFKRLAGLSAMTTLRDWQLMKTIIKMASNKPYLTEEEARLTLWRLIERAEFSKEQLVRITRMA